MLKTCSICRHIYCNSLKYQVIDNLLFEMPEKVFHCTITEFALLCAIANDCGGALGVTPQRNPLLQ